MRNKQNYQSDILLVTNPADSSLSQSNDVEILNRIQDGSFGFSVDKTAVNQFGKFGKVKSQVTSPPIVRGAFTYYMSFETNEEKLGFFTSSNPQTSFLRNSISTLETNPNNKAVRDGKNFFILTSEDGHDANNVDDGIQENFDVTVMTFAGCHIDSYSMQASVGSIPEASFSFLGSQLSIEPATIPADKSIEPNIYVSNPYLNQNPLADPSGYINVSESGNIDGAPVTGSGIGALRPSDIKILAVRRSGESITSYEEVDTFLCAHAQSVALDIDISRTPVRKLGSLFNASYELEFPIDVSLQFSSIVSTLKEEESYEEIFKDSDQYLDFWVFFEKPAASVVLTDESGVVLTDESGNQLFTEGVTIVPGNPASISNAKGFVVRGCELVDKNYSQSISSLKTISASFKSQIGGANDPRNGVAFIDA